MNVQPYLVFGGRCEEAIEFYRGAVGAKVERIMRWKDCPDAKPGTIPPGVENKVMHASFKVGDTSVMASDGYAKGNPEFKGFSLSITARTETEADKMFNALAEGGQVQMPLTKTFFSPRFGMVADKFGVGWMVIVAP